MKKFILLFVSLSFLLLAGCSRHERVPMYLVTQKDNGKYIGYVALRDTDKGLLLRPHLTNLTPGNHGFHAHTGSICGKYGMKAKGHLDPNMTGKHLGPYGNGHLGDLPFIVANKRGIATTAVLAPRLKLKDLRGHTLMIHANGDNYSDTPKPLGGGGARVACGAVR